MRNKSVFILVLFIFVGLTSFGQEHETVLSSPEDWKSEIIPFPIGFAQDIKYEGIEDLRFTPKWSDSTSQQFWTYMFVWYIEKDEPITEIKLTEAFISYYDGLMGTDPKNQDKSSNSEKFDQSFCLFVKTDEGFTGKMRVYDRFFTKDYIVFNIKAKESFCPKTNKQIIWCDISPQPFDHEVWSLFSKVKLAVECE